MKENLYLQRMKERLNKDSSNKYIFDESQTGPQEEPTLIQYQLDVERFQKYIEQKKKQ